MPSLVLLVNLLSLPGSNPSYTCLLPCELDEQNEPADIIFFTSAFETMIHTDFSYHYQFVFCSDLLDDPRHCSSVYVGCCGNSPAVTLGLQQQTDKRGNGGAARPRTFHVSAFGMRLCALELCSVYTSNPVVQE